jgi:7-cyano-7-deazaguanine tRNA-ribosyltransferase
LRRAEDALPQIEGDDILWVGPVQGGGYLDLVEHSAKVIGSMPFKIHALGSPTQVMERYLFTVLVDMIMAAKLNLPPNRPFHLFGAGQPMMFSLAVALGCDMFDSAAYALFARKGRYLTPRGTLRLRNLSHLPCSCPVCRRYEANDLKEMLRGERIKLLTEHNLYVCMAEMDIIKQAISEGTLWKLLEVRSRGHPALASAFKQLNEIRDILERGSPSNKGRGVFIFDSSVLARPELTRHIRRLQMNYHPPDGANKLLLVPAPSYKPFNNAPQYHTLKRIVEDVSKCTASLFHICFYVAPFGIVPVELSETFPLSQFEAVVPLDIETLEFTAAQVGWYAEESRYSEIILHRGFGELEMLIEERFREVCEEKGLHLKISSDPRPWSEDALKRLGEVLGEPMKMV